MSIQQIIDKQTGKTAPEPGKAPNPRGVIFISNESGSFEIPEGVRLVLSECTGVTCTSNEGRNELTFIDCTDASVEDFKEGVLRFERCKSITKIATKEDCLLTVAGAEIQELDLKKTDATIIKCEIQQANFEECILESIENTYEEFTFKKGQITSEEDEFQQLQLDEGTVGTFVAVKLQGDSKCDKATVTFQKVEGQGNLELKDTSLMDNEGEYQDLKVEGTLSTLMLKETKIQGDLELKEGSANFADVEVQGNCTFEKANVNAMGLEGQGDFEAKKSSMVMSDCEFQGDGTLESSAVKLVKCKIQKMDITDGAFESEKCEYQGEFKQEGGTIESIKDKFSDEVTIEKLIAWNKIFKSEGMQKLTLSGEDSKTSIELVSCDAEEVTIEKFGRAVFSVCQFEKAEVTEVKNLNVIDCEWQEFTGEKISTSVFDYGQLQKAEFTDCSTIFLNNSTCEELKTDKCFHVFAASSEIQTMETKNGGLAVTDEVSDMTAEKMTVIDSNSTIQSTDALIIGRDSTIQAEGGLVMAFGGDVTASSNMAVLTTGATVTNADGLTMGTGFSPEDQAGCILQDGVDTTVQASIGNLNLKSLLGDVNIEAETGNINETALESIVEDAGLDITSIALGLISHDAALSIDNTAGEDFSVDAGGSANIQGGASVNLDAPTITVNAASITILGIVNFN